MKKIVALSCLVLMSLSLFSQNKKSQEEWIKIDIEYITTADYEKGMSSLSVENQYKYHINSKGETFKLFLHVEEALGHSEKNHLRTLAGVKDKKYYIISDYCCGQYEGYPKTIKKRKLNYAIEK